MGSTTTKANTSSVFGDNPPEPVGLGSNYPGAAQLCNELSNVLSEVPSDGSRASLAKRQRSGVIVRKAIEDVGKLVTPADRKARQAPAVRTDTPAPGSSEFPDGSDQG